MMIRKSLAVFCLLAACDTGGGNGPAPEVAVTVASQVGKTFVPAGPAMALYDGYDPAVTETATVMVISSTQINLNGVVLTKDPTGTIFRSNDGTITLDVQSDVDNVGTDQILYMMATQKLGGVTSISTYVAGNASTQSEIPRIGTAAYSGSVVLFNDTKQQSTVGGLVFVVSLDTSTISGGLTFAGRLLTIASASTATGSFKSTLTSGEATPVVTGEIDGAFYGAKGQEIGGTINLDYAPDGTSSETYVGYYGTTQQ
jgi:hypothetical protein